MRNETRSIKEKLISKYLENETVETKVKSTNINILLNRIKTNKKSESRKKLYFSAAVSTGLILFGVIIF
jgi:hypothetical protein